MNELLVLKIICVLYFESQGRAVSTSEIIWESGLSKSKFYSSINSLIEFGYISRVMRGFYTPTEWYQNTLWDDGINE
jgi:DNA-binding IclR family transcriptional regulator